MALSNCWTWNRFPNSQYLLLHPLTVHNLDSPNFIFLTFFFSARVNYNVQWLGPSTCKAAVVQASVDGKGVVERGPRPSNSSCLWHNPSSKAWREVCLYSYIFPTGQSDLACNWFVLVLFFPVCGCDLAQGGFFIKNGEYLCTVDYQRMYGTRCNGCGEFVEGEVVTALGKTYHPNCFACTVCKWVSLFCDINSITRSTGGTASPQDTVLKMCFLWEGIPLVLSEKHLPAKLCCLV